MPPRGNDDFSAPSGFGSPSSFAGPSAFRTLAEEDPVDLTEGGWTKPKKPNRADVQGVSSAQNEASIAAREALIAQYGTSDKDKVAQLMSLGVFEKDAGTRYKLDPEGFKTNVGEALKILGRDGVNATPDGEAARKYRVGVGQGGEPYYTNLSNRELHNEQQSRLGTEAHAGESQHSVYDLKNLHRRDLPEGSGAAAAEKRAGMSNAEQMFEGNLDRATDRAMKDERDMEHTSKLAEYSDELIQFGHDKGGNKARERIQQELMDGTFLKKDFTGKEAILLNRMLEKRIRTAKEIHQKRLDPNYYIVDVHKDPTASDPTQPASFANPGGGVNPQAITTYEHQNADNNMRQVLDIAGNKEQELPRTAQYANGKKAPKSQRSLVETGGSGGSLTEDISGFLEGKGRAGYGESGVKGVAKDIAGFYGPRLPGDIAEAAGGVGVKRIAKSAGKKFLGLRAIENMLGKF
jgi:hypothetical protein